ncbi:MAG: Gldg family protein [Planctomycetes bacterium]|nr:Gldg family protein [Planctomycetota bacterium]MCB9905213.1 Gldg family protein [Planctomycetota bacterium]
MSSAPSTGTTRWTRLAIGSRVALNVVLAVAAALGLTILAGNPALRARVDLTADQRNRLDPATERVIAQLPEKVQVDVFFRPVEQPLTAAFGEAQARMYDLLLIAADLRPDKVKLVQHDLSGAKTGDSKVEQAMAALGVEQVNVFVVSTEDRRVIVPIFGEVAEFDIGMASPDPSRMVPPSLAVFRGEEALLEALLQVSQTEAPHVYFSYGHGEPDLYGDESVELSKLHSALVADGFRASRWDPLETGPVPDDAAVLAVMSPLQGLDPQTVGYVRDFVERGGSLIAAANPKGDAEAGGVAALVEPYGIRVGEGLVCMPIRDAATNRLTEGTPECSGLTVPPDTMNARHPVTESLRRGGRRVRQTFTRPLELTRAPDRGLLADLMSTLPGSSWIDLPDANGEHDWRYDESTEQRGAFLLAATSVFPPTREGAFVPKNVQRERPESRVLVTGSHFLFSNGSFAANRDFALNAFNWASSREFRARISPRSIEDRRLAVGADDSLFRLHVVGSYLLPLVATLAGAFVALRRRRIGSVS